MFDGENFAVPHSVSHGCHLILLALLKNLDYVAQNVNIWICSW